MAAIESLKQTVTAWLPPVAGVALVALFVSLASWQLDRAAEKKALAALFAAEAGALPLGEAGTELLYRPVTLRGRYLPERQVLIDNIIKDSRVGYYVITPFAAANDGTLRLVNRGWIAKAAGSTVLPDVDVAGDERQIAARVGRLPRVALRPEAAFGDAAGWPRVAVYPELADVAAALGRELAEPVLLLGPGEPDGYLRDWQPAGSGPATHYGYAFQWSALAVTVLVIMGWQWNKRRRRG